MSFGRDRFKRMFPNLAKEMEMDEAKVDIISVRTNPDAGERAASRKFVNYNPDVIDFLRRCETEKQAEEIISYMEKRGEINRDYASKLKIQLKRKGVRSFGSKKENDYYLKHGGN